MKRNRRRWLGLVWLVVLLLMTGRAAAQQAYHVDVLQIEGPVAPIMLSYIERGVRTAEGYGAQALIIELNTPGGDINLMNKIDTVLLNARVPTVVYVYPSGGFAASAGTLITLSARLAAMAPGTTIGAASPVGAQGTDLATTEKAKVTEDMKAQARGLAQRRGAEAAVWAESAVAEAKAANAEEAKQLGIIDFIATDLNDLLRQMDGRTVTIGDQAITLHTAGAQVRELPMTLFEQILHVVTNPTIAVILLSIGPTAILFELSSPGGYAAGIFGAICLILGFYAVGVLPVNYTGLIFIVLAFIMFIVDIKAPTHGVLTFGGIISLIAGGLILFNSPLTPVAVAPVVAVALVIGAFFAFAVSKAVRAQKWPVTTGREQLIGEFGEARTPLQPRGMIFVRGELWQATADDGPIDKGERVQVTAMEGFRLRVIRTTAELPGEQTTSLPPEPV